MNGIYLKIFELKREGGKRISSEASINPNNRVFFSIKEHEQRKIKGSKARNTEDTKKLNVLHREIFCPVIPFPWETEIRKERC